MRGKNSSPKVAAVAFSLAIILSCALAAGEPKKAQAVAGLDPGDTLSIPIKNFTQAAEKFARVGVSSFGIPIPFTSLDSIMKLAVKKVLGELNGSILAWINTGSSDGGPMFITDLNVYLNQVGSDAGSKYLMNNQGNFCGYFGDDLNAGLATYFQIEGASGGGGSCEFDQYEQQGFFNDFNNGGWDAWISLTQNDNNNPMGAWLTQKDAMNASIQQEKTTALEEARWGDGIKSQKDASGKIITPGKVIGDQLSFVLTSDQRQLENAKSFDDIVTTMLNSLMTKVINGTGRSSSNPDAPQSGVASLSSSDITNTSSQHLAFPGGYIQDSTDSNENNIAPQLVGKAKQSSIRSAKHDADVALTGGNNLNYENGGVSLTGLEINPWWQVDLGKERPVTKVTVRASTDPEKYPLTNTYVYISKNPLPHDDSIPEASETVWRSEINPNGPKGFTVVPEDPIVGRFITVKRVGEGVNLGIGAVEIYANSVPQIFLVGEKTMTVPVNTTFVDPGWTAIDENDGDLTRSVIVTGAVATSTPGSYTLKYEVKNSAKVWNYIGASPVTRTVIVQ